MSINVSLLPVGIALGIGEEARVDGPDPLSLVGRVVFMTFNSIRQEPIASAVYLQKIGAIQVDDILRDKGARETKAFPMKE